jgi:hypothetical protein
MTTMAARDERTLSALFAHPLQHNIRWQDVLHLCNAIGGDVEVLPDQRLRLRLIAGGYQIWLHARSRPGRGVLHQDDVLQLRRCLTLAGIPPSGERGAPAAASTTQPVQLLIRIDHRQADIYRLSDDRIEHTHIRPHGLWGSEQNLSHRHERDIAGQRAPLDKDYLQHIATAMEQADQVVLCGHGHGEADVVQLLLKELQLHRPDLLQRVIATERLDDPALTERQLLRLAAHHFGSEPPRLDAAEAAQRS